MTNPFEDENGVYHVLVNDEANIRFGRPSSTSRRLDHRSQVGQPRRLSRIRQQALDRYAAQQPGRAHEAVDCDRATKRKSVCFRSCCQETLNTAIS